MPRRKRQAKEPPRHLDERERNELSWNTLDEPENGEADIIDDNMVDLVDQNEENGDEKQPKRTRLEIPSVSNTHLNGIHYLTLNYYDNRDKWDNKAPDDCVFQLFEFSIDPLGSKAEFDEFIRQCHDHNTKELRLYFHDPNHYYKQIPLPVLSAPLGLQWPMVNCQTSVDKAMLRLMYRKNAAFHLTYDHKLTAIRIWVKEELFGAMNGVDVNSHLTTALQFLMKQIDPVLYSGSSVSPEMKRRQKFDDNAQILFNDLKKARHSILSMVNDNLDSVYPDIE